MPWPTMADYQEAIQNPRVCFDDPDLKTGTPVLNVLGLPKPITGAFASVYQLSSSGTQYAVRCFLRYLPDQEQRYAAISDHLRRAHLPYTVSFNWIKQGIRVRGQWYPILKMEWLDGATLSSYIEQQLYNPSRLSALAERFKELMSALGQAHIAHGDLQHGNILIVNHTIRLIDYDGMFVPGLSGMQSHELGHRNYQHPGRATADFGPHIDNFSAWVIYLSLRALSLEPELWRELNAGDECLLFRHNDFLNLAASPALHALERVQNRTRDQGLRDLLTRFRTLTATDLAHIPALDGRLDLAAGPAFLTNARTLIGGWLGPPRKPAPSPDAPPPVPSEYTGPTWVLDYLEPTPDPAPVEHVPPPRVIERYVIGGLLLFLNAIKSAAFMTLIAPGAAVDIAAVSLLPVFGFLGVQYALFPEVQEKYTLIVRLWWLRSERALLRFRLWHNTTRTQQLVRATTLSLEHLDSVLEREIEKKLATIPITQHDIPDLNTILVWRLRFFGIRNVSDINHDQLARVPRIDAALAARLVAWRAREERHIRRTELDALNQWRDTLSADIRHDFTRRSQILEARDQRLRQRRDRIDLTYAQLRLELDDYTHVTLATYLMWIYHNVDD